MSALSIVIAIFGLALLIVLHEGGHFLVARLCGMRVERFSIGFGPPLVSFKRGGTIFQIAPIFLGGFVQITGLNPNEEFDKNDPMVYPNRPRWMRLLTVLAGPAANYLTAIVLVFVVLLGCGHVAEDAEDRRGGGEPAGRDGGSQGRRRPGRGQRPGRERGAPDQRGDQGGARGAGQHQDPARRQGDDVPRDARQAGRRLPGGHPARPIRRPHTGVVRQPPPRKRSSIRITRRSRS